MIRGIEYTPLSKKRGKGDKPNVSNPVTLAEFSMVGTKIGGTIENSEFGKLLLENRWFINQILWY